MLNRVNDKWNRDNLVAHLEEFYTLYKNRPIKDNDGGMKSPHMFNAWYVVKKMQPEIIIESGVWKGLGTWFFRQASPSTKMVCFDPNPQYRQYTDPGATYITHDFLNTDWMAIPKKNTLVFFDDHQDFMPRLRKAKDVGFKYIMVEDNYPVDQGDCYSPKKILSGESYVLDSAGKRKWMVPSKWDKEYLTEALEVYQEMPPIFGSDITRWGTAAEWPLSLLPDSDSERYPELYFERLDYTWICYMELK